jgi:tetratricopeptide (TPR) repeat protein
MVRDDVHLIGRADQLAHFRTAMARVTDGENAALIFTGVEGAGKTALLHACQAEAEAAGWVVLSGGCDPDTLDNPYAPFLSTLGLCFDAHGRLANDRSVTSIVDALPLDDILAAVVDIPLLGAVAALGLVGKRVIDARQRPLEGEELINHNFEFVRQIFEQIARRRRTPILLSFDDLQYAGETPFSLLNYLLTRLTKARFLFLGAWQPDPTENHPPAALRKLSSMHPLPELDRTQTHALVHRLAPELPLPPERLTRIREFSHGLPGLIAEIVHLLREGDDPLDETEGGRRPSGMVSAIARRYLIRYPPETLSLLECAAVLGRQFPLPPLTADPLLTYLGLNERRVLEILTQLAQEGRVLAFADDDLSLRFTSDYLHAYLCHGIPDPLARRDHLRLAQSWQQADPDPPAGPLARHFFLGGQYAPALDCASRVAETHLREAAYPEALQAYDLALKALNHLPPADPPHRRRIDLLTAAAFAAEQSGRWPQAIERLQEALSLADARSTRRAEILGNLGWLHFKQGDLATAVAELRESAGLYAEQEDRRGQFQIDYYLGVVYSAQKNWGQAVERFQACLAAGEKMDDDGSLARVHLELGNLIRQQRRWAEAEEHLRRGIALAEAASDYSAQVEGHHYLGVSLGRREKPEALEHLHRALALARNHTHQPHQEAKILNTLAESYVRLNRWDEAVAAFEGSAIIKRRLGDRPGLAMTYGGLGRLYHRQWRADLAAQYYQKDLDILRQEAEANVAWIQQLLNSLAEAHRLAGDFDAAETDLAEAMALADRIPDERERDRSRGYTYLGLARLALDRGQPAAARPHVERAQTLLQGSWMAPEADRVRGWLERLAGDLEEAQVWLDRALPRLKQSEEYEQLMAVHEAAQLAQARGDARDARRRWQETLTLAERLANEPLQQSAREALAFDARREHGDQN